MSKDILIETSELSSRLLKKTKSKLDNASDKLGSINHSPVYYSATGYASLYPLNVSSEVIRLKNAINTIQEKLQGYANILDTGPDAIVAVDNACKSELTTWFDRADHSIDNAFADIKTGAETVINYWVDNYKNKGWSYKVIQSAIAIGKAVPVVVGCAASWVAAPWAPTTWLSTVYGVNAAASMWADLDNIWNENFEDVGNINILKDTLVENGGKLSEMLCGDERIGEIIGSGVYSLGEIITAVSSAMKINKLLGKTTTKASRSEIRDKIKAKLGIGEGGISDLKSQVIQSDFSFKTVTDAIKETPKAIKGLWDIAIHSPLSAVAKDYKLLSYTIPNIIETVSAVDLLNDMATKTSDIVTKGIEFVQVLAN